MSVFEILTPEFLDELPLMDPEAAFPMIVQRAFEHAARALQGVDDNERSSWAVYEDAQHTAMNAIIAAAKRLEVQPFANMEVPRRKEFGSQDFTEFKVDLDHYLTQTLLDNGIRQRRDSVVVPPKVKDRLKTHLHAMRTQIDQADMPESKRKILKKKLSDFEQALERSRLPIFAVARIVLEILSVTANVLQLADSPTFAKLTSNIMHEVARAKAEDDATRQLPPADPPRLALPPRTTDFGRKPAKQGSAAKYSNDDIPF